jgi:hypothetical protein
VELHRPSRDAPAPIPIWLETAVRPHAVAQPLGTCAASGPDPTLWPAQCCSVLSCHLDSSVSVMILENVMWRNDAYVSDASHRNATHLIYSH